MKSVRIRMKHFCNRLGPYISNLVKPGLFFSNIIMNGPNRHSGYLYYIDGYKKWNRSSQTTVIDIKTTALKNAIEWHWSPTSEMVRTLVKFH